jgi:hypothetical protein
VAGRANLVAPGDMKRRASQDVRGGALEVGGSREVRDEVACEGGGASWGGGSGLVVPALGEGAGVESSSPSHFCLLRFILLMSHSHCCESYSPNLVY